MSKFMYFTSQYLWRNKALLDHILNQILNGFKYAMFEKGEYWDHQEIPKKKLNI